MVVIEDVMGMKRAYGEGETALEVPAVKLGVELLSRQGVCYVWTFRDQITLSVCITKRIMIESRWSDLWVL
jgi:hypothetical protein